MPNWIEDAKNEAEEWDRKAKEKFEEIFPKDEMGQIEAILEKVEKNGLLVSRKGVNRRIKSINGDPYCCPGNFFGYSDGRVCYAYVMQWSITVKGKMESFDITTGLQGYDEKLDKFSTYGTSLMLIFDSTTNENEYIHDFSKLEDKIKNWLGRACRK